MRNLRRSFLWILFFTYIVGVFLLMVLTINTGKVDVPKYVLGIESDKIVHFIIFLPYITLAWIAFVSGKPAGNKKRSVLLIFVSGLFLAVLTESAQLMNPQREFDLMDIMADVVSLSAVALCMLIWISFRYKKGARNTC